MVETPLPPQRGGSEAAFLGLVGLFIFYAVQTAPMHFFYVALPIVLREGGASLSSIGLTAVIFLPWSLKIFWAGTVDRFSLGGRMPYRNWVLITQLMAACACAGLAFVPPVEAFQTMLILATLIAFFCATQDVAVDGWSSAAFGQRKAASGGTMQGAGSAAGAVAGGAVMLVLYGSGGWPAMCFALAGIVLLSSLAVFLMPAVTSSHSTDRGAWRRAWMLIRQQRTRWLISMGLIIRAPAALITILLQPLLLDLGAETKDLVTFNIFWTMGASALGAVLAGIAIKRLGGALAVYPLLVVMAVLCIGLGQVIEAGALLWAKTMVAGIWFAGSYGLVLMYQLFLRSSGEGHGGFDFTFFVTIDTLIALLISPIGAVLADQIGVSSMLWTVAALYLLAVFLARGLLRQKDASLFESAHAD